MNLDEIRASVNKRLGALTAELEALKTENSELRKQVERLASEPDPAQAPFRGTSVVVATPDTERPSALKAAMARDEREQVEHLERMAAQHPNPELRERARRALMRRGGTA
jgi:hypothetical protein